MLLLFAALLVVIDQASKFWVARAAPLNGEGVPLILGFDLTYTRNNGAAFGTLRNLEIPLGPITLDGTLMLGLLSAAVALVLVIYLLRNGRNLATLPSVALVLILAGAVGNMLDRLRLGYVVDFLHFQVGNFDFPVFNVADSCVVIGASLLLLGSFLGGREASPPSPVNPAHEEPGMDEPDLFGTVDSEKL